MLCSKLNKTHSHFLQHSLCSRLSGGSASYSSWKERVQETLHAQPSRNFSITQTISLFSSSQAFSGVRLHSGIPVHTSVGMTSTDVQAGSRGIEDSGKGQTDCWRTGLSIPREREGQAEELCVPIGGCWSRHLGYVLVILEWEHFSFVCGERGGFRQSDF